MAATKSTTLTAGGPDAKPTHTYKIVFDRRDDGEGTLTFYRDGEKVDKGEQTDAGWDDATPWAASTYELKYHGMYGHKTKTPSWEMVKNPEHRTAILLHQGSVNTPSQPLEGCIGASATFLKLVHDTMVADKNEQEHISLEVNNDFNFHIAASVDKQNLEEGESAILTISLEGDDIGTGLTKDIWVKLDVDAPDGTAKLGQDFTIVTMDADGAISTNEPADVKGRWDKGYYVKVPLQHTSVQYRIDAKVDADDKEPAENISLDLSDYFVVRDYNKVKTKYSDELTQPGVLMPQKIEVDVTIGAKDKLTEEFLSGDIAGYKHVFLVDVGDVVIYDFDAHSIPDSLTITGVSSPLATGFMSYTLSGTLTASSTSFSVVVVGSEEGTLWDLHLHNLGHSALAHAIVDHLQDGSAAAAHEQAFGETVRSLARTSLYQPATPHPTDAAATLVSVFSQTFTLAGDTVSADFTPTAGHTYFVRMTSPDGTVQDGMMQISSSDDGGEHLNFDDTLASAMPSAFIVANSNATLEFDLTSHLGESGSVKLEIFDATHFTGSFVSFENQQIYLDEADEDGSNNINLYRFGDISQAETYTLKLVPDAANGFSAGDFEDGNLTITVQFDAGDSVATVDLKALSDGQLEGLESGKLVLDLSAMPDVLANMLALGIDTSKDVVIHDPDVDTSHQSPELQSADIAVSEDSGHAIFTLTLSQAADSDVSVSYVTIDGTATAGDDYTTTSGTVTFAAGQTTAKIDIGLLNDGEVDEGKTFSLNILDPYGLNLAGGGSLLTYDATLTEAPKNTAPKAVADTASTDEHSSVLVDVLANDSDAQGDPLSLAQADVTSGDATATIENGKLRVTYTGVDLAVGDHAEIQISYQVSDGQLESTANLVVTVSGEDDHKNTAPTAADDAVTTNEHSPALVDVLDNDFDAEGDPLSITQAGVTSGNGSVKIENGQLRVSYTGADIDPGDHAEIQITYHVSDGELQDTATLFVTVNGQGEAGDPIIGNRLDNTLVGTHFDDAISGLGGEDHLFGKGGKDHLDGGRGDDFLYGGAKADIFEFGRRCGNDIIMDFRLKQGDRIDLSGIKEITDYKDLTANHLYQGDSGLLISINEHDYIYVASLHKADLEKGDFLF